MREDLDRNRIDVGIPSSSVERSGQFFRIRLARAKGADTLQKPLLVSSSGHMHAIHRPIRPLLDLTDPSDDAETKQKGSHVLSQIDAARAKEDSVRSSPLCLQCDRPVCRPQMSQQDSNLPVAEAKCSRRDSLLVRPLTENTELPQP